MLLGNQEQSIEIQSISLFSIFYPLRLASSSHSTLSKAPVSEYNDTNLRPVVAEAIYLALFTKWRCEPMASVVLTSLYGNVWAAGE